MSNLLPTLARWLFGVGLAVWLGGLLAIGAIVAPVTAHFLQSHPAFAADPLQKAGLLTAIVGGSLRVFNFVCYGSAVLLLAGQAMLWPATPRRLAGPMLVVTLVLLASAAVLGFVLFPQMDAAQATGQMNRFNLLHHRYEAVSIDLQFPLLLVLALLAAARDSGVSAPPSPSAPLASQSA